MFATTRTSAPTATGEPATTAPRAVVEPSQNADPWR